MLTEHAHDIVHLAAEEMDQFVAWDLKKLCCIYQSFRESWCTHGILIYGSVQHLNGATSEQGSASITITIT